MDLVLSLEVNMRRGFKKKNTISLNCYQQIHSL